MEKKDKGLSTGHLTMMALGTVIGGSFFLGSSVAIHAAGPSIIISYIIGGILVYFILSAISEMTIESHKSSSFRDFAGKFLSPGIGFIVGWVYWTGMVLAMSSEAAAASILVRNWYPGVSVAILGSLIIIAVTLLNLLGTEKLSKLENSLVSIKLFAIIAFIVIAFMIVAGFMPGVKYVGIGAMRNEPFFAGGIKSLAGSMLIVMFAYAGFEVIGLAANDTENPKVTIPKTINYTVSSLVALFVIYIIALLPLIPTASLNENKSAIVASLSNYGIGWASSILNIVLITAIISTMLAAMFGLGRMIKSIADEGHAPKWLKDEGDNPKRGILFTGFSMLLGLGFGLLFPSVYMFLISSGGFAVLFTYAVILASHINFRKESENSRDKKFNSYKYPYASWVSLISIIIIIVSMPFVSGQSSGLVAGLIIVALYSCIYAVMKFYKSAHEKDNNIIDLYNFRKHRSDLSTEFSEELHSGKRKPVKNKKKK